MAQNKLTALHLKHLDLHPEKMKKHSDGAGLYLIAMPKGGPYWRYKYHYPKGGPEKALQIGVYPQVSLELARQKRDQAASLLAQGIDPMEVKKSAKEAALQASEALSLTEVSKSWLEDRAAAKGWNDEYKARQWKDLEKNILPWLGGKKIELITAQLLDNCLQMVVKRGARVTAKRVLLQVDSIFRFAERKGLTDRNPAYALKGSIEAPPVKHLAHIQDPKALAQLIRDIDGFRGAFTVRAALRIAPLVFLRPNKELCQGLWQEIDWDEGLWVIPAERMKKKREHVVPLAKQALAILEELHPLTGGSPFIFQSPRDPRKPIGESAIVHAIRQVGWGSEEMTGHGFRHTASTMLHEMGFRSEHIETQLSHKDSSVRGVYNKAQYLHERIKLMQAWADYLDALKAGGKVIPFRATEAG